MAKRSTSSDDDAERSANEAWDANRAVVLVLTSVTVVGLALVALRLKSRGTRTAQAPELRAERIAAQARRKLSEIQDNLDSFRQLMRCEPLPSE